MPIILNTSNGNTIRVENEPFAKGGEGAVHRIIYPSKYAGQCAKIYYTKQRNQQKWHKIEYMVHNPPPDLTRKNHTICWPQEVLFKNGQFIGFTMPLAFDGSIQLYELCTPKFKAKLGLNWLAKFDRESKVGIEARLKLCTNLAAAIHIIHSLEYYVLVDLKPQNILVTDEGKISVIDCDSIQISNNGKIIFPARVATAEYVPPEGANINPSVDIVQPSWDQFSLAIMFYELLFGLHPYAASFTGRYQDSVTLDSKIKSGLFVHGQNKKYLSVLPPLHQNFGAIANSIRNLFVRAFENGNQMPDIRPTAEEWGKTIFIALSSNNAQQRPFVSISSVPYHNSPAKQRHQKIKQAQSAPTPPPGSRGGTNWVYGLLVVAVLVIIGTVTYISNTDSTHTSPQLPREATREDRGEQIIRAFIQAEDSKKIDDIMAFYSDKTIKYYGSYLSKQKLKDHYLAVWERLRSSSNEIQYIKQQGMNQYLLTTKFTSVTKTGKQKTVISNVFIRLLDNKIVDIYSNPDEPPLEGPKQKSQPLSKYVDIGAYYRMVENTNLRSSPTESSAIKWQGKEIDEYVRSLSNGYTIRDIRVYVSRRERIQNTVNKGCDERGKPYWYDVKLIFPNGFSKSGWMWGGCLVPAN